MLTTHRRDRRTRRQALLTLESLDDRLVLSAMAAGAAAEAMTPHAALVQQRHEARLARIHARHEARLAARAAAHAIVPSAATMIPVGGSTASAVAPAATAVAVAPRSGGTLAPSLPIAAPAATTTAPSSASSSPSASSNPGSPGPLPANVSAALQSLYSEFQAAGDNFKAGSATDATLVISGNSVAVNLKVTGDFNSALGQLEADGMQVSSSSSAYGLIEGMLPIADLPAAAQIASSVTAIHQPQRQSL